MWEGIDLKKDLGRFCIIAKAPFAPGSGALVQAKRRLQARRQMEGDKRFLHTDTGMWQMHASNRRSFDHISIGKGMRGFDKTD